MYLEIATISECENNNEFSFETLTGVWKEWMIFCLDI